MIQHTQRFLLFVFWWKAYRFPGWCACVAFARNAGSGRDDHLRADYVDAV